jgi:hypothetical protein
MNQTWFFLIAIAVIGLFSFSFYLYRYSSLTSNGRTLELEGNFTYPLNIQQVESMLGSFNISNVSSNLNPQNGTNPNQTTPSLQDLDQNYDPAIDLDRNLVDTLSRIIISALKQSNLSSQKSLDSTQSSDFSDLSQNLVDGEWNASIVAGNIANFSGLINTNNIGEDGPKEYLVKLEANRKEIEYLERKGNLTIVIRGNGEIGIDNQQFEVPTVLVIHEMKEIYLLMFGNNNMLPDKFFLYGKVSKTAG